MCFVSDGVGTGISGVLGGTKYGDDFFLSDGEVR